VFSQTISVDLLVAGRARSPRKRCVDSKSVSGVLLGQPLGVALLSLRQLPTSAGLQAKIFHIPLGMQNFIHLWLVVTLSLA
jgi:hypothetical protein